MEMKKLLESLEECGINEMPPMAPPVERHEGSPVSMNVSLNASGKDHVADLLDMMKNAGLQQAAPVSAKMLSPRMDMERLRSVIDGPEMGEEEMDAEEGYENEPEVSIGDIEDVTPDGDDLHRSKDRKAIRTNDPALESIKDSLYAALSEKKAKPDFLDVDKDGDKKEPMKKALKDKGSKPKKGEVPPQFKKK